MVEEEQGTLDRQRKDLRVETAQRSVVGKWPVQMARYRMELDEMELVDKKCR